MCYWHSIEWDNRLKKKRLINSDSIISGSFFSAAARFRQKSKTFHLSSDAISAALSALYAKVIVIIGIALPITEILTSRIPNSIYQGFYVYLYAISIAFVVFVYVMQFRRKAVFTLIKNYRESHTLKIFSIHYSMFTTFHGSFNQTQCWFSVLLYAIQMRRHTELR